MCTNAVSLGTYVVHGVYYKLSVYDGDLVFSSGGVASDHSILLFSIW